MATRTCQLRAEHCVLMTVNVACGQPKNIWNTSSSTKALRRASGSCQKLVIVLTVEAVRLLGACREYPWSQAIRCWHEESALSEEILVHVKYDGCHQGREPMAVLFSYDVALGRVLRNAGVSSSEIMFSSATTFPGRKRRSIWV